MIEVSHGKTRRVIYGAAKFCEVEKKGDIKIPLRKQIFKCKSYCLNSKITDFSVSFNTRHTDFIVSFAV
jgi:hypothetical protein